MSKQSEVELLAKAIYEGWHDSMGVHTFAWEDVSGYHREAYRNCAQRIINQGYVRREALRIDRKAIVRIISEGKNMGCSTTGIADRVAAAKDEIVTFKEDA